MRTFWVNLYFHIFGRLEYDRIAIFDPYELLKLTMMMVLYVGRMKIKHDKLDTLTEKIRENWILPDFLYFLNGIFLVSFHQYAYHTELCYAKRPVLKKYAGRFY